MGYYNQQVSHLPWRSFTSCSLSQLSAAVAVTGPAYQISVNLSSHTPSDEGLCLLGCRESRVLVSSFYTPKRGLCCTCICSFLKINLFTRTNMSTQTHSGRCLMGILLGWSVHKMWRCGTYTTCPMSPVTWGFTMPKRAALSCLLSEELYQC